MTREELLHQIKSRLQDAHGERLRGVVLYGSEARGDASPDSDIDVLVLLAGPVAYGQALRTSIHALYPLTLQLGRPMNPKVVDAEEYESQDCPLYRTAKREGILA